MPPDRHSMTEMHLSTDDATGDPTPTGYTPISDGAGGVQWSPGTVAGGFELRDEGGQSDIMPHGPMGATENFDPSDGNIHTGTLNADCVVTLLAPSGSGGATLEAWITNGGGFALSFLASGGTFQWDGETPDIPSTGTFRVILERIPATTNDWIGNLVGSGGGLEGVDIDDVPAPGEIIVATSETTAEWVKSGRHLHIVNELMLGDGAQTVFTLAQECAEPDQGVAAYVSGVRWSVTLGGMNDQITFAMPPGNLAEIRVDYLAYISGG